MPGCSMRLRRALLVLGVALPMAHAHSQGTVEGEKLFRSQCAACHSAAAGEANRQGPNLFGIIGRPAGTAPGMVYSDGFKKTLTGRKWDAVLLDKWLEDPQEIAPDSVMMYKQSDSDKRQQLIQYLNTLHP